LISNSDDEFISPGLGAALSYEKCRPVSSNQPLKAERLELVNRMTVL